MIFSKRLFSFILLSTLTIGFLSCDSDDPFEVDYSSVPEPFDISSAERVETETGLVYYNVEAGSGEFEVQRRSSKSVDP